MDMHIGVNANGATENEPPEPLFEVAQLAHVEILTPKPTETLWFFTDLLGMEATASTGQSVYLRAYEDPYHHSLKITEAPRPGLGHVAWRTTSPQALRRRVKVLEASGAGRGWIEDEGHGSAYQFVTPDGHNMELLWDVEYYACADDNRSWVKNRPQRRPRVGVPVRRIDHVNILAHEVTPNRDFMVEQLGFRLRENKVLNDGTEVGAWLSVSPLVHEIAIMRDRSRSAYARFHHVCYWYGYPQHLWDVADLFVDNGITIEAGPSRHGTTQAMFLYVYEPGGNRVELFGDSGYLIFDPAWKTITWTEADDLKKSTVWIGAYAPNEFYTYGTPHVEEVAPESVVADPL